MKKLIKPQVTVAVCAYNEEKNILKFIKSALSQKEVGFELKEVWIFSDGSTDNTVRIAKSVKSAKIKIWEYKNRLGKSSRLNDIYKFLKTDILVQSDADIIFSDPNVIRALIMPLTNEKKVGMCGGHPQPVRSKTFTEKAVNTTFEVYSYLRKHVREGNNIFSADGRLLAFKKQLVKKINVPKDMIANDAFAYYSCLELGYKYKYVPSAKVFFRSPQNLKDQIIQNTRFLAAPSRLSRYFSKKMVHKEYYIPTHLLLGATLKQFLKHPILTSYIFLVNRYCQVRAYLIEKRLSATWDLANTTKLLS